MLLLTGSSAGIPAIAVTAILDLAMLSLNMFFFVILVRIILSWVSPHHYNPVTVMLGTIAEPILAPFRRLVRPIGGIDISPIFAIVLLQAGVIILQTYRPLSV